MDRMPRSGAGDGLVRGRLTPTRLSRATVPGRDYCADPLAARTSAGYGEAMAASPPPPPPTRGQIVSRWLALIEGRTSREAVHEWSAQWVEDQDAHVGDPMVWNALLHLHGFDTAYQPERPSLVRHGPPGLYVHSHQHIVAELSRWRTRSADYDADPDGFRRRARDNIEARLAVDGSARRARERARARIAAIIARQR